MNNRETADSRWRTDTQGRGGRGGRRIFSPRHPSHDAGSGRNASAGKENGVNQMPEEPANVGASKLAGTPQQPSPPPHVEGKSVPSSGVNVTHGKHTPSADHRLGITGYRVFLGHKQYFVSSDVGAGKMQWYAFHKEPPGGVDVPNGQKERLLKIFGNWCDNVVDLLNATEEEAIIRRDIYDRTPIFTWGKGRVTLLGDSVHAMQPNMGQGGCMAIEDGYQLALELEKAWTESVDSGNPVDVTASIQRYEKERRLRVAIIYGMAKMAAIMASTYKPYLGVGLGPLSFLTKFRIPHPGRVGGRVFIDIGMPLMLSWVLGGNSGKLEGRSLSCRLTDKASDQLQKWFRDNDALERSIKGEWFLFPSENEMGSSVEPIHLSRDEHKPYIIGNISHGESRGLSIVIPSSQVSEMHARISYKDGAFYVTDLQSEHGTWVTNIEGRRYRVPPNFPARFRPSDKIEFGSDKAAFRVKVLHAPSKITDKDQQSSVLQAA